MNEACNIVGVSHINNVDALTGVSVNTAHTSPKSHNLLSDAACCGGIQLGDHAVSSGIVENSSTDQLREAAKLLQQAAAFLSCVDVHGLPTAISRSPTPQAVSHSPASGTAHSGLPTAGGGDRGDLNVRYQHEATSSACQHCASAVKPRTPGHLPDWATVERALTNFDKQEIGGYKEDIDSLLTFVSDHVCALLS